MALLKLEVKTSKSVYVEAWCDNKAVLCSYLLCIHIVDSRCGVAHKGRHVAKEGNLISSCLAKGNQIVLVRRVNG